MQSDDGVDHLRPHRMWASGTRDEICFYEIYFFEIYFCEVRFFLISYRIIYLCHSLMNLLNTDTTCIAVNPYLGMLSCLLVLVL